MGRRGFRGGFGKNRGNRGRFDDMKSEHGRNRQDYQRRVVGDEYDSDQDFRRSSNDRMRRGQRFRNHSGGGAFLDNDFRANSRQDNLDYGFDDLAPVSSTGLYGGSNMLLGSSGMLGDRILDSSEGLMGLGTSMLDTELIGRGSNTRHLEDQLRMRETQLAMTSNLLKEQTQLLAQVGGALRRRSSPGRRELQPDFRVSPGKRRGGRERDFSPKRIRRDSWSGDNHSRRFQQSDFRGRGRGLRGGPRGRGGLRRGGGNMQSNGTIRNQRWQQKPKNVHEENKSATTGAKTQNKKRGGMIKKFKAEYSKIEDIPEHDSSKPVGDRYIVSVQGFYCKLCNKFYQNEHSAKVMHASQETHYEKWKSTVLQSIKDRNKGTKNSESDVKSVVKTDVRKVEENQEKNTALNRTNGEDNKDEEMETSGTEKNSNEVAPETETQS